MVIAMLICFGIAASGFVLKGVYWILQSGYFDRDSLIPGIKWEEGERPEVEPKPDFEKFDDPYKNLNIGRNRDHEKEIFTTDSQCYLQHG